MLNKIEHLTYKDCIDAVTLAEIHLNEQLPCSKLNAFLANALYDSWEKYNLLYEYYYLKPIIKGESYKNARKYLNLAMMDKLGFPSEAKIPSAKIITEFFSVPSFDRYQRFPDKAILEKLKSMGNAFVSYRVIQTASRLLSDKLLPRLVNDDAQAKENFNAVYKQQESIELLSEFISADSYLYNTVRKRLTTTGLWIFYERYQIAPYMGTDLSENGPLNQKEQLILKGQCGNGESHEYVRKMVLYAYKHNEIKHKGDAIAYELEIPGHYEPCQLYYIARTTNSEVTILGLPMQQYVEWLMKQEKVEFNAINKAHYWRKAHKRAYRRIPNLLNFFFGINPFIRVEAVRSEDLS